MNNMKRKKIIVLGGALLLAAVLFWFALTPSTAPEMQSQEVSLRADIRDVSIDDMISTVENRKLPNESTVVPGFTSSGRTSGFSDDPEAVARIQSLIRASEENLSAGLAEVEMERQGGGVVSSATSQAPPQVTSKSSPVEEEKEEEIAVVDPPKRSPFNSVAFGGAENRNAIKAYVHSEQTVMIGSTLKMRLGEDAYTDDGTLVPKNSPIFGEVTSIDGERVNVRITHINHRGNILAFDKQVYSKDALLGIYVPGNPKAEASKDAVGGAIDGMPTSGIPGVDAAAQIATVVASSAASAGKQAVSKNVRKVKVTIKTNYEIFLRPDDKRS